MFKSSVQLVASSLVLLISAGLGASRGGASTVVVPDDVPSVQAAIDSGADTVLIREGAYPERPLVSRPVVLQGMGIHRRPQLAGLDITNQDFQYFPPPRAVSVIGVNFTGRVDHATVVLRPRGLELTFFACSLEVGFNQVQSLDPYDIGTLTIRNCYLGGVSTARIDRVIMEADTVSGGGAKSTQSGDLGVLALPLPPLGAVNWELSIASIEHCVFRGGGLTLSGNPYARVAFNRLEDCAGGLTVLDAAHTVIDSNTVSGCKTGIVVTGQVVEIFDNSINQCGIGVYAGRTSDVRVSNNRIIGSGNQGILTEGCDLVLVDGNVLVGGGGGPHIATGYGQAGVVVAYAANSGTLQKNTIVADSGSGIVLDHVYSAVVDNNIGFGNGGWGLSVEGDGTLSHRCNDWFANGLGAVKGLPSDSTDASVDPSFCDVDRADVRLNASSALLKWPGCGQIGALGVGCGVTATLVQRFSAARVGAGVRVVWEVAEGATASEIWLERSEAAEGERWVRSLMERTFENRAVIELDRSAEPDRAYWYRLVALDGGDVSMIGAPILVQALAHAEFRLTEVGPNPGNGPVRIGFALKHGAAVEIDVFDIQGRRIASLGRGAWRAGTHEVVWDGGARNGNPAPAGMYVVRYAYPGGQDRRAIVRVR